MRRIDEHGVYQYLDHEADIKIKSTGKSVDYAFAHQALALGNLLVDIKKLEPTEKRVLSLKANRITELLYVYLEEILRLIAKESYFPCVVSFLKIGQVGENFVLDAVFMGSISPDLALEVPPLSPSYDAMCLELDEDTQHFHITTVIKL